MNYKDAVKENTKVSYISTDQLEIQTCCKDVTHLVKVTSAEMKEETQNRENIEEQTEAVFHNQYLGLCDICQAILLSKESFKNHRKEHEEKIGKCPSTVNPWSSKPSCDGTEKATFEKTKPSKNICVKCSYCQTVCVDTFQLKRHWFKRKYCCLQYNAVSEPVTE